MNTYFKLMYTGRNLMDELATVEIAIDVEAKRIHLFDAHYVCEPQYDAVKKAYSFSDETTQLARVLFEKEIVCKEIVKFDDWVRKIDWVFYCSKPLLLRCLNGEFLTYPKEFDAAFLYKK
ncbi:MAG: hypothetical protein UHX00_15730 [Caryophanon sp.]|nr:hypothetical protein [Caryophanon sp.]